MRHSASADRPAAPVSDDGVASVWYAAYGSNLELARLMLYLEGGTHPLTGRVTPGCRDHTPPRANRPAELDVDVVFARHSRGWEGGIAFLDADRPGKALVRLWLITAEQFADIVAQENVAPTGTVDTSVVADVGPTRPLATAIDAGWYGRVRWCGTADGVPILTCTADWDLSLEAPNPPTPAYLATMARGLVECGHDATTIVGYLSALRGVAPEWSDEQLHALLP